MAAITDHLADEPKGIYAEKTNCTGAVEAEKVRRESATQIKSDVYQSTITQAFDKLMDAIKADEADGWKCVGKKQGVTKHKKDGKDGKVCIFRGEKVLDFSPNVLLNCLQDQNVRVANGNGVIADLGVLEQVEEHCSIQFELYKVSVPFVAPRDIVYVHTIHTLADGTILSFGSSVEHPDRPQKGKCVRAELGIGGWAFQPVSNEPGKTKVVYVGQIDFVGAIPKWLMNRIGKEIPMTIERINQSLLKMTNLEDFNKPVKKTNVIKTTTDKSGGKVTV